MMSETDGNIFSIDPCPKCGGPGDYIGGGYGEWRVIACKCGYNAPGMAVAGTPDAYSKREQDMLDRQRYLEGVIVEMQAELERRREEAATFVLVNNKLKDGINLLRTERDDLRKRLEDANGEIEHLRDTRQDPFDTIEVLRAERDSLHAELQKAHERIVELTEQANAAYAPYRERVMAAREEANKLSGKLAQAREAIASVLAELHDGDPLKPNCMDCGKPYEDFLMDVVLSDEQWQMIHPDKNGLLCADCIVQRASELPGAIIARMTIEF
jgi:uncharacterized coiled-coil DUF342 family protein